MAASSSNNNNTPYSCRDSHHPSPAMAGPPQEVEARSLSAINHLAAHPPQYPINPTERHESLPLYISRVPGSRDVILSTFKPGRKNVSGEDVANSLYYVHLDTPGDELLAPKAQDGPRSSMDSTRTTDTHRIARKPLPASARVPPHSHLQNEVAESPVEAAQSDAQPAAPSDPPNDPTHARGPVSPNPALRKPIGPRAMSTEPPSPPNAEAPPPYPGTNRPATPPTPDEARPALPPRPVPGPLRVDAQPPRTFDELCAMSPSLQSPVTTPSRSPSPWSKQQKPFTPFSLTIIRRDPGTGHQWNVGKITSFQSTIVYRDPNDPDAPPITQYPKGFPAINVHIETSGYARFRNFPMVLPKLNVDARPGSSSGSSLAQSMKELAAQVRGAEPTHADSEGGFTRQVVMTYSKTWTHNIKEAFMNRNRSSTTSSNKTNEEADAHSNEPLHPPRASDHRRQDSGHSTNSNDSTYFAPAAEPPPPPPPQQPDPAHHHAAASAAPKPQHDEPVLSAPAPGSGLRPKGYTFTSPWDGRCDFRTASSGRSLKCHHTRNTTSQGFNPLVAAQALKDAAAADGSGRRGRGRGMSSSLAGMTGDLGNKVPVSELRFNLPSVDLFNSKEDRERAVKELSEGFGRMLVRSPGGHERDGSYGDGDESDEPIFDFSGVGREKAGGGNRGKRAKLGKLIVHDEGFKMLDLVVASNMGIWWQTWERSF